MTRSIRFLSFATLLSTAGLSGLACLLINRWFVLLVLLPAAVLLAWFLARQMQRSLSDIRRTLEGFGNGKFAATPRPRWPVELVELAVAARELGATLEQRDLEKEKKAKLAGRAARTEALQRFANEAVRELHKTMSSISGFVDLAQHQPNADGPLKNYLTLIDQEARASWEILDKVLRYVREEPFEVQACELNALLKETVNEFAAALEQDRVQWHLNLAPDLPLVSCEPDQLKHVLAVLIDNAREAMLPNGGTLDIGSNRGPDGKVAVSFRDSGRGIPPEDQERLFTPFFTTKSRKGAGLNLAVCQQILVLHGGGIDFRSRQDEGTVFFLSLPADPGSGPAPQPVTAASP